MPQLQLLDLPDEILVHIGVWASCFDVRDLARLRACNRQLRRLLITEDVLPMVKQCRGLLLADNNHNNNNSNIPVLESLPQVWLYELVRRETSLLQENRIGFEFASLDIMNDAHVHDDEWEECDIRESTERVEGLKILLQRHGNIIKVVLDAHCGIAAPNGPAPQFSLDRGTYVANELLVPYDDQDIGTLPFVEVSPWGKLVVHRYCTMDGHRSQSLARRGKGWVEVRLQLSRADDTALVLPPRPIGAYNGLEHYGRD